MLIQRIANFTRVIGKAQGYRGLPLRDGVTNCSVSGQDTPTMETAWQPTPAELILLNAGANIHVMLAGSVHPPIIVSVGPVPGDN